MDITYLGHSSFKIKGKTATVVTDPFDESAVGLKYPAVEADIVTTSHDHDDHGKIKLVKNYKKAFTGPGEYEVMGISFIGIPSFHDEKKSLPAGRQGEKRGKNTIFVIEVDGVRICHLGDLGHKLTEGQLKKIGDIDVLMIPVGGEYTIDSKLAVIVMQQIEASYIIPMHYQVEGLKSSTFKKLEPVENFLKASGMVVEKTDKLVVKKEMIVDDQPATIVVMDRKR